MNQTTGMSFNRLSRKATCVAIGLAGMFSYGHFGALAGPTSTPIAGTISDVTIALGVNWTKENGIAKSGSLQTQSGTAVTASLGNKEFLQYLVEKKLIGDTTVTGWKIVDVRSHRPIDGIYIYGLFAFKIGKSPVEIPADLLSLSDSTLFDAKIYGEAETYSQSSRSGVFTSSSNAGRYVGGISGTFPSGSFKGVKFKAVGFDSRSVSTSYGKSGEFLKDSYAYRKITGLVGASDFTSAGSREMYELPMVEGSVSIGATTSADVAAFKK